LYAKWVTPISSPTDVVASGSSGQIAVTWSTPSDLNGQTITAYQVEYAQTSNPNTWQVAASTVAAGTTSYTINSLNNSNKYYVRVVALTAHSQGSYGYPWTKVYGTSTPHRTNSTATGVITYQNGYGLSETDAQANYQDSEFSRVRYLMKSTYGGQANVVDADFVNSVTNMPAYASGYTRNLTTVSNLKIPAPAGNDSQFIVQGNVSDMTVRSNVEAVNNGNTVTGGLEFFPWNYCDNVPGSSAASCGYEYDAADTATFTGTYGSFQLHNLSSEFAQTAFAWNRHFDATNYEIGFGSYVRGSNLVGTDWTFCGSRAVCTSRSEFSLEIFINAEISF
jgi:hypothetical protein